MKLALTGLFRHPGLQHAGPVRDDGEESSGRGTQVSHFLARIPTFQFSVDSSGFST